MKETTALIGVLVLWLILLVITVGAWIQHFVTTITEELWVLLVIGVLFPPIGVLHGWLVWLGVV